MDMFLHTQVLVHMCIPCSPEWASGEPGVCPSGGAAPAVLGLGLLLAGAGFFINPFCELTREFML